VINKIPDVWTLETQETEESCPEIFSGGIEKLRMQHQLQLQQHLEQQQQQQQLQQQQQQQKQLQQQLQLQQQHPQKKIVRKGP
jgi:hypothetical protein